jgi:hypothetical protein
MQEGIDNIVCIDPNKDLETVVDLLLEIYPMKFDVVIGNPPYQAPKELEGGKKKGTIGGDLWSKFVKKSVELCKDDGYISLIHPPMWRKPEHEIWELLNKYQILYLEIHSEEDGKKTFGAATKYDWYVIQKTEYKHPTSIMDELEQTHFLNLKDLPFLPNYNYENFWKLIAQKDEETCNVIYSRSAYGTDKAWMSKIRTEDYKYPVVHGMQKNNGITYWYSNKNNNGHFNIPKVILGWGRYQYPFVDIEGKYGMTQIVFGIAVESEKEAEGIRKAIESDHFKDIIKSTKWSSFQTEWRMFKYFKRDFWKGFL